MPELWVEVWGVWGKPSCLPSSYLTCWCCRAMEAPRMWVGRCGYLGALKVPEGFCRVGGYLLRTYALHVSIAFL